MNPLNTNHEYTTGRNYSYFGQVPTNYTPANYRLSKGALESSQKIFQVYDRNNSGYITIGELEPVLRDTFGVDNMPPPAPSDVAYLLDKYDFNNDRQLNKREFRRLMKELAGLKKYDKKNINTTGNKKNKHGATGILNAQPMPTSYPVTQPMPTQTTSHAMPMPVPVPLPVHTSHAQSMPQQNMVTTTTHQETYVTSAPVQPPMQQQQQYIPPPVQPPMMQQQQYIPPMQQQQPHYAAPMQNTQAMVAPIRKAQGPVYVNPTPRTTGYPIFGTVPVNYHPNEYGLSRNAIKRSRQLFKQYDTNNDGTVGYTELNSLLAAVFAVDGLQPPQAADVAYLLDKYDLDHNHRLTHREFKRLLKELSGNKQYDKTSIKNYRYDTYTGPYPNEPGYVAPAHPMSSIPPSYVTAPNVAPHYTAPPTNYAQKMFVLSPNAVRHSKVTFRKYDANNDGFITASQLDNVIREIFVLDHQQAPSSIDIANVLFKYDYQNRNAYNAKEVKRILKDLTGAKTYNKSSFGFFSRIFK